MPDPPGVPVPGGAGVVPAVVLYTRLVGNPLDGLQGEGERKSQGVKLVSLCLVDAGQAEVSAVGVPVHQDALGPEAKEAGGGEGVQVCPEEEEEEEEHEEGKVEEKGGGSKPGFFFYYTIKI